jgi:hypothetical protein
LKVIRKYQFDFDQVFSISKGQDGSRCLQNDHEKLNYRQDHEFMNTTQKKINLLMKYKLVELGGVNPKFSDQQHWKLYSTDSKGIDSYFTIQMRGWDEFITELVKDILNEIRQIESRKFILPNRMASYCELIAIHLYVATAIDFLHSNELVNPETIRNLFQDDKCLFWITNLNMYQMIDKIFVALMGGVTDISNQWFWTLQWGFLKGLLLEFLFILFLHEFN